MPWPPSGGREGDSSGVRDPPFSCLRTVAPPTPRPSTGGSPLVSWSGVSRPRTPVGTVVRVCSGPVQSRSLVSPRPSWVSLPVGPSSRPALSSLRRPAPSPHDTRLCAPLPSCPCVGGLPVLGGVSGTLGPVLVSGVRWSIPTESFHPFPRRTSVLTPRSYGRWLPVCRTRLESVPFWWSPECNRARP